MARTPQESSAPTLAAAASTPLQVRGASRLAFGATTLALVVLASAGTGVLVNHGTRDIGATGALPASPAQLGARDGVIVDRAPGTLGVGHAPRPTRETPLERVLLQAFERSVPGTTATPFPVLPGTLPPARLVPALPAAPVVEPPVSPPLASTPSLVAGPVGTLLRTAAGRVALVTDLTAADLRADAKAAKAKTGSTGKAKTGSTGKAKTGKAKTGSTGKAKTGKAKTGSTGKAKSTQPKGKPKHR